MILITTDIITAIMPSLRDFIASRREEIKREISSLRAELRELSLAESAIKNGTPETVTSDGRRGTSESKITIKDMVLEVLADKPAGAEATEILNLIANRFGEEIPRPSLSPQLSRLKEEGRLALEGRIWRVAENIPDPKDESLGSETTSGGGEVRGRALPTESPEGANPSTSSSDRPERQWRDLDDEIPF